MNKRTERIITIGLAISLVAYFCYQDAYGTKETCPGLIDGSKCPIMDNTQYQYGFLLPEVMQVNNGTTFHLSAGKVLKNIKGNNVVMFGFNGQVPGPIIKVKQGSTILVNFINNFQMREYIDITLTIEKNNKVLECMGLFSYTRHQCLWVVEQMFNHCFDLLSLRLSDYVLLY